MLGFSFRHFVARERYGVLDGDGTEMGRKERRKEGRKEGRVSLGGSETACWTERKPWK